jgi:CSLREA domain-containing protein
LVAALVALACWGLTGAPAAMGAEFLVDSKADEVDGAPGDESCRTAAEECTLRAAIEEGNGLGEFTRIDFEEETFEGQVASTIVLGSSLPAIAVPAFINGRNCETEAGVNGPCVGIDGLSTDPALIVANAEEVEISGLAMTGAQTAISLEGSPRTKIQASWLGVALDGALAGNETGILVGPGSNRSLIGGEGPGQGNVFAASANDGLDVHGGNNVRVFGNYFGVEPDGVTPAPNGGDDIEVVSIEGSEVTGTAIGTRVSAAAVASPSCDGGCNVISGAGSNGIDLEGDGAPETEAASTTSVAGNYIGLNAEGTAAVPNADAGVRIGEAAHTIVGGPSGGDANHINGGNVGILAGPAAGDLAVRGNLIGTDATGEETLDPPDEGIVVDSGELPRPSLEAEIAGNEVAMEDGVAILQRGEGAWIFGNEIFGSQTGIRTLEPTAEHGNVIEANLIEGPATNGILVENDFNEIVGNGVFGAGAAGIRIQGSPPFGVSRNLVGGDAPGDENTIDGSGDAAIEISNLEATDNEVTRNQGIGNGGPFIDLVALSPGTEAWPNRGIEPPTFATVTQTGASGSAEEGATVRVFRKQLAAIGELESFIGEAVANGAGFWDLTYDATIPAGTIIAATQTKEGSTSELAITTTPGSESTGGGAAGDSFGISAPDPLESAMARLRPQTKIVRGRSRRHAARFAFRSDQAGSAFLCKLDGKPFDLCKSPKRYVGLAPGKHVFWVRAIDPAGRVDLSPAKKKFVVPG